MCALVGSTLATVADNWQKLFCASPIFIGVLYGYDAVKKTPVAYDITHQRFPPTDGGDHELLGGAYWLHHRTR